MFGQHCTHTGPHPWGRGDFGSERGRGFARFGGRHGHFERFFAAAGGRERMFEGGDLQLVMLSLLAEKPSYGYELIKAIEDRMGGGYAPSPGVVYPTLTLLEERGFAQIQSNEGSRKVYAITEAGREELKRHEEQVSELRERLQQGREHFSRGRSPQMRRAFMDLRQAVVRSLQRGREAGAEPNEERMGKIVEAIQQAVRTIDAL